MCTISETCRANSVIKTALNNLHQAGPNKTHKLYDGSLKRNILCVLPYILNCVWIRGKRNIFEYVTKRV